MLVTNFATAPDHDLNISHIKVSEWSELDIYSLDLDFMPATPVTVSPERRKSGYLKAPLSMLCVCHCPPSTSNRVSEAKSWR